jgi:hypothetical protein
VMGYVEMRDVGMAAWKGEGIREWQRGEGP